MIHNKHLVVDVIGNWIKRKVEKAGMDNVVVGISGGADSALVAIICKMKFPNMVGVFMPCHSSPSSLERAKELCDKFKINHVKVDLGDAFSSIAMQVVGPKGVGDNKAAAGALRSCLRAPTLDFVAKLHNALVVGTGNRDEDEVTRYFQKRGDGAVDISPIAKLHKSEVYDLLAYLNCPESIMKATPTADLWGPDAGQEDEKELGLTYAEIEWFIGECDKVECDNRPPYDYLLHYRGANYTERQKFVAEKLIAMEKNSRHKSEMPPVFEVRQYIVK